MKTTIALAGNPNSGKTTLFNWLTGANQYVGNWPGVTVERKGGKLKGQKDIDVTDLPGIYSLSPYTPEEIVSRDYLLQERPDVILDIVDASNLERNLYLTTQLMEAGIPVVVALNMMDVVRKRGDQIDTAKLSALLGVPVHEMSAVKGDGTMEAAEAAVQAAHGSAAQAQRFSDGVEAALDEISSMIADVTEAEKRRWYTVRLFERDKKVWDRFQFSTETEKRIEEIIAAQEKEYDDDSESIIASERYEIIAKLIEKCVKKQKAGQSVSDRIDAVVTNRILALPIFVVVMFLVYTIAMGGTPVSIGTIATDFANDVIFAEWVPGFFDMFLLNAEGESVIAPWLYGLIQDGIVAGVGAVLGFVPQMLVLFLVLSILEECGYMSRIAFIMDRIFRRFGLSGKAFIPMLVATGCGVPGLMATRTIEQERDRRMSLMTTAFMPCGAKLPIIGLISGALFGGSAWVATSAYFIGIAAIVISGIILKKTKAFAGEPAPFVMELPAYHPPLAGNVLRATWERGWSFIKRAGTIILLSTVVIWFLQSFGMENGALQMVDDPDVSILAALGSVLSVIFMPLGFGDWKTAVACITGLVAKENVVATMGQLYHYAGELSDNGDEIWTLVAADFTALSAYSFMIFNLLCAPCFAAMGAIRREMNNAKWTFAAIGYMCLFAYITALIVYQIGGLLTGLVPFGAGTIVAVLCAAAVIWLLVRKGYDENGAALRRVSVGQMSAN